MRSDTSGRRGRLIASAAAVVLLAGGITTIGLGLDAEPPAPAPTGEAAASTPAGRYKDSPTPGRNGSAIILGHVNTTSTDVGLFYRLHELTPGKTVTVTRTDHTAAVFTVDKVDVYYKAAFPTVEVYKNADRPELRLITCGGYNPATREYLDNTVVYAHLTSTQPA